MMSARLVEMLLEIPLKPLEDNQHLDVDYFIQQNGKFPDDYLILLTNYHGGTGVLSEMYIDLWEPAEISDLNLGYNVQENAPGFTIFGSDGGGTVFAFERSTGFIYHFAFIGILLDDSATLISESFEGFLIKISLGLLEY